MKKSKFLKNSKDFLSRSFNPSKCKTSLRLAGSRLKLLRNKKEVQVKQMKREIAQLLESGQDRTARIRVEHVVREEKMMAAYDLIQIYCELLVARLAIIESQKICPIDLKEAVASVIFASPRCGDVPELVDVRKQFTEKYGKDFMTAAIELRPECGVSRMLIEKLSAIAPDGQTKMTILSAIAEEHNVKWDAHSLEERDSVPPSELITGPVTFEMENKLYVEPPDLKCPGVQFPQNNKMYGSPLNFSQMDERTSKGTERHGSVQHFGAHTAFQHEGKPQGDERAQLFQGDSSTIPSDRRTWNMEFKDATAAAQAAAESAQLASMAARAAAELAIRDSIMRQSPIESNKSDVHVLNGTEPEIYMNSKLASQFSEESINKSFSEHTRLRSERMDGMKPNNLRTDGRFENSRGVTKEHSRSTSLKSKASFDDDLDNDEMSMQRQSFNYNAENTIGPPENSENVREEKIARRPRDKNSHSHSSISYGKNIFSNSEDQQFEYGAGNDPSLGKASIHGEDAVFDKYDFDNETHGFSLGPKYDEAEPRFHSPSSGKKSQLDSWSPRSDSSKTVKSTASSLFPTQNYSSSELRENLSGSKWDEYVPVTFDESDGPASESDEDLRYRHLRSKQNLSPLMEKGSFGFDRKQSSLTSDDELSPKEVSYIGNSSSTNEEWLNFDKLTGSFRHKGYNRPPYLNSRFEVSSSVNNEREEFFSTITSPRISTSFEHKKSTRSPDSQPESDSDSSEEEESLRMSSNHKQVKTNPSLEASKSIFGFNNSDLDEDCPNKSFSKTSNLQSEISRRTKASASSTTGNVYYKTQLESEAVDFEDSINRKHRNSNISETPKKSESRRNSSKLDRYEQPKTSSSVNSENVKAATLSKTCSSKDESNQKTSHVHPKLPDYDTLVQSLRKNRP